MKLIRPLSVLIVLAILILGVCLAMFRFGEARQGGEEPLIGFGKLPALTEGSQLAQLVRQVDALTASPKEKLLLLNAWVYSSLKGNFEGRSFTDSHAVLQTMTGDCGTRDILIRDVLGHLKVTNRQINFFDIPVLAAHSATEAQMAGRWYFVDGTVGLYFADPEDLTTPLSIESARSLYPDIQLMRVAGKGWTGEWHNLEGALKELREGTLYQPYQENILFYPVPVGEEEQKVVGEVEKTFISSRLLPTSPEYAIAFPISLDLRTTPSGAVGEVDQSLQDLTGAFHPLSYGSAYDPYFYAFGILGENGPRVNKEYLFLTDVPRNLNLTFHFIKTVPQGSRRFFLTRIKHAIGDFSSQNTLLNPVWTDQTLTLKARVNPPLSTLYMQLSEDFAKSHAFALDAIQWESVPLKEKATHRVFE